MSDSYSRADAPRREYLFSATIFGLTALALWLAGLAVRRAVCHGDAPCYEFASVTFAFILLPGAFAVFLTAYQLQPAAQRLCESFRQSWRPVYTVVAFTGTIAIFSTFILHFGNRQFGGYDFSQMIDSGWRPATGQLPYRDYICTLPPGSYLGVKYAFQAFGLRWDSQLYALAIFSCAGFVWIYLLLARLLRSRLSAFLIAATIECVAALILDFWSFNAITVIAATIFFLSCVLYLDRPTILRTQISYAASLALLGLMKPNVAGTLGIIGVALVFVAMRAKARVSVLTLIAIAMTIGFLVINGVSVPGLVNSYRAAAVDRGRLTAHGFYEASTLDILRASLCLGSLCTPFFIWWQPFIAAVRRADTSVVCRSLLLVVAPLISVYGMFSNAELKDVELPLLISAGAVLLFGVSGAAVAIQERRPRLSRFYVAFLCALVASDLYMGARRYKVQGIGMHTFYYWNDSGPVRGIPFFGNLQASARFRATLDQIGQVLGRNQGPVFFGPRMEFAYAVFGLPSPKHLPVWWDPGTSFAVAQYPSILEAWRNNRFRTLVFLKHDFTRYSPEFLQLIDSLYAVDESYPDLTLFHSKPDAARRR